jgi:nucleotide-binding universal stress UspA family protein
MSTVDTDASDQQRPTGTRPGIRRILLATDLGLETSAATERAIALAVEHHAGLLVLSVIDPASLRLPGGRFKRRVDQERARVEGAVQALVGRARSAGAQATFLVWEGEPVEVILLAAAAEECDLIVVGSHGRGRLGRLLLGSVSTRLIARARDSVLVVPA